MDQLSDHDEVVRAAERSLLSAFAAHCIGTTATTGANVASRIDELADAARRAGWTPEAMVIDVKRLAREAGWIAVMPRDGHATGRVPREQVDAAISRAITRFFASS